MTLEKAIEWRDYYLHLIKQSLRMRDQEAVALYIKKARLMAGVVEIETVLRDLRAKEEENNG